jgi:hypothetical protein
LWRFQASFRWFFFFLLFHASMMLDLSVDVVDAHDVVVSEGHLVSTSPIVTTKYLHWSEQPIEFNREDHPMTVPHPGNAPLVLKAQIGGYDIERVFMDAGSGINLIYAKTL